MRLARRWPGGLVLAFSLIVAAPLSARDATLAAEVAAVLAEGGPGTRFGLLVTAEDGGELIAIDPDRRFMPASNTKILTTAAAYASLAALDLPDATGGASVRLEKGRRGAPDVILTGHGDARLSSAPDCVTDCLAVLADAIAAKTRRVRDVIGDATRFPDERWSPGMSWNNIPTCSGTAISALTLDDNELRLRVTPTAPGRPPTVELLPYYRVDNRALTVASGPADLEVTRLPGSDLVRLTGTIGADAASDTLCLGIDDPAHYAAWRLKALLEARGVKVKRGVQARYRPADGVPPEPAPLARLTPPPLAEDVTRINKVSQNVHAELLIRRLGAIRGTGAIADGIVAVEDMMARAGVPRTAWDLSDGSGMSSYNRLSPRAVVALLRWIAVQPWGATWRATLPIAGVDGTLARRFRGTPLEGRLFAKTGTLNATNALSGYLTARSGRTLTFAFFANDVPGDAGAAARIDAALQIIAARN